jgi:glycosyltransferase involved in cell wall biosynthesis
MHILFVESSRSWGGQEYRTCLEINWLNQREHQAWLVCDRKSEVFSKASELGTRVRTMPLRRRFDPLSSWRLWRFCQRNKIDLIKTYSSKDHWLSLPLYLCGIPVVRARCITDPVGNKWRAFIYKHGCAKILADAQVIKKQLVEQNGIPADKIAVIGSGVDLAKFAPGRDRMKLRQELGFSDETPVIVNIGMIRYDKGQTQLLKAARMVLEQRPDVRFVFVGQATGTRWREAQLQERISDAGLEGKIIMLGYRWDTPDILAAADIVVIASLGTEASSIVLREAFASGRAVVATKIGDVPEVVQDRENGLIVEPADREAMAKAILELLSNKQLGARCAAKALQHARDHFSFDRMMEAKLDVDLALSRNARAPQIAGSKRPIDPVASEFVSTK